MWSIIIFVGGFDFFLALFFSELRNSFNLPNCKSSNSLELEYLLKWAYGEISLGDPVGVRKIPVFEGTLETNRETKGALIFVMNLVSLFLSVFTWSRFHQNP
jgi:hypothetical protein